MSIKDQDLTGGMVPGKIEFVPNKNWSGSTPHTCPVCKGRGTVPEGFYKEQHPMGFVLEPSMTYTTLPKRDNCKSCQGTGIVWS